MKTRSQPMLQCDVQTRDLNGFALLKHTVCIRWALLTVS